MYNQTNGTSEQIYVIDGIGDEIKGQNHVWVSNSQCQISKDDETVQYVMDMWTEKKDNVDLIDKEKDCIGARYLNVVNHMSFLDYAIFTVVTSI